jgi:phosphatidylglycerol:prolipoprotein diacylglycerol transferase
MQPYFLIFGLPVITYSLFLAAGIILCLMIFMVKNTMFSLRIYELVQSLPFTFGGAFIGGNLLSLATVLPLILSGERTGWDAFFSIGFVFYGGFLGLTAGILIESRRRKKPVLDYTDTLYRLFPLGQAVGRVGCYFNGCCYGIESDSWLAIPYAIDGMSMTVIPVPLIEALFCFLLGVFLLIWKPSRIGSYTFVYVISYAAFRFVIEFFRGDEIRGIWGVLSTSQWISLGLIVGSIIIIGNHFAKNRRRPIC